VLGWPVAAFGFDVEIVAADACEGLTYSAIKQSPYLTSTGTQYAEFDLQCTVTNLPPNATVTYQWSPVQTENPPNPPAGAIWVPSPGTAASTPGWAYGGVGLFTASCTVTVTAPSGGGQETALKTFLVVGGPLQLVAYPFRNADGTQHANYIRTFDQDEDLETKPFYLQFFGYDPTVPHPQGAQLQRPQLGRVQPRFDQPDMGPDEPVQFLWEVPPGTKVRAKAAATLAESSWIELAATQESGSGGIQPRCKFKVKFRGKWFEAWDDSPLSAPPGLVTPNPDYFRFTAHKPLDTLPNSAEDQQEDWGNAEFPYGWIRRTRPVVLDHLGQRMPDVWVQERFQPPTPPQGSDINTSLVWWQTVRGNDEPLSGHPCGRFGLGSTGPYDNGWDNLWLRRTEPYRYADHPYAPFFDFVHHYYAGTKVTVGTGNGCFVGTYRIKLWTDRVEHIKE
jgi:hypothetical protein